jgi:signal transduction histidine kinase
VGGRLAIDSTPGHGTTIHAELPIREGRGRPPQAPRP